MQDDPGPLHVILVIVAIVAGLAVGVGGALWAYRRIERAARTVLHPLLDRLREIASVATPHPVPLYAAHGFLVVSTEYRPTAYLTRENAAEVEALARKMRAFTFRWGCYGHGGLFIPLLTWWNYRKAFATIASYRRSA